MSSDLHETRFIEALTRYQPALEAFCHANVARREDSAEVLQATCVKLWQKASDWDSETPFLPWAFTVARFVALSHIRDKMRERLIFDEDVLLSMAGETEKVSSTFSERRDALRECLSQISSEQRDLLHAHYVEERRVGEIARATGRGESAVKMILLRLRRLLGECIEAKLQTS